MKKLLISIIGIIIFILIVVSAIRGIKMRKFSIYSINDIKEAGYNLDKKIEETEIEQKQNYAKAVNDANKSVQELKDVKQKYEEKIATLAGETGLGITQIEKYKIEYLWNKIGNYAKKEGVALDLDVQKTTIDETYNVNFSLEGNYVGVTDFIYDIENDDELNYKVKNFKMEPTTRTITSSSGKTTTEVDKVILKATFTVENIIINFN